MGNEISVNAVLVEMEDGSYKANCPDIGINAEGPNADEALQNLKGAVIQHIKDKGLDNVQLSAVKCMKIKIPAM